MPAHLRVGVQGGDAALEHRVPGNDELASRVDRMHEVRFDGLANLDGIVAADFDLEAGSLGEHRLDGRCLLHRLGWLRRGAVFEGLCASKSGEGENCRNQNEWGTAAGGKEHPVRLLLGAILRLRRFRMPIASRAASVQPL